jgi:Pilus formation protein N terminal region
MSAVFGRRRRLVVALVGTLLSAAIAATPAQADTITVVVDSAHVMKLPDKVATIVIGNPLIADAALQSGGILVVTGKGFGSTNLLVLDRAGKTIMDKTVQVLGPVGTDLVVLYRGVTRETYSCSPQCERRITLGDDTKFFGDTLTQSGSWASAAQATSGAK